MAIVPSAWVMIRIYETKDKTNRVDSNYFDPRGQLIKNVRIEEIRRVGQGEQMRQKAQRVSKASIADRDAAEKMGAD